MYLNQSEIDKLAKWCNKTLIDKIYCFDSSTKTGYLREWRPDENAQDCGDLIKQLNNDNCYHKIEYNSRIKKYMLHFKNKAIKKSYSYASLLLGISKACLTIMKKTNI
jgi:hypothetical protein